MRPAPKRTVTVKLPNEIDCQGTRVRGTLNTRNDYAT